MCVKSTVLLYILHIPLLTSLCRKGGLEDTLEQLREEQAVKQRELDEAAQKAVEKCSERIDTRRREGELRIELKTLKQQIAHMESE